MIQSIQYYSGSIYNSAPLGFVCISRVLESIRKPKQQNVALIERIRAEQDKKVKAKLKEQLYSFTPCAIVNNNRKYEDIKEFTGIVALDFDKLPDEFYAQEFKEALFSEYPFIFAAWLSSSKKGVRALAQIPKAKSVDEFKEYYFAIEAELSGYEGYDGAPKNCILPMFYSIDESLLYREKNELWTKKHKPIQAPKLVQYHYKHEGKEAAVEKIICNKINQITDNGHPQLRAAAYLLGGYVGAGHMREDDAKALIVQLIESNHYLSIKPKTYIRTAMQFIESGQSRPVYLK